MSKLIIIRGNSGSGKSTIAKRLQRELGYGTMLIPQDVVRREILRTQDALGNPTVQLIRDLAIYGQNINYNVIIEGILVRDKYGDMLKEVAATFDEVYVYYLDISFKETLRRHQMKPNANEFGEVEMREWYVENDQLGIANEKIVADEQSEDETLSLILNSVQ